jgi:hypothetical protein
MGKNSQMVNIVTATRATIYDLGRSSIEHKTGYLLAGCRDAVARVTGLVKIRKPLATYPVHA